MDNVKMPGEKANNKFERLDGLHEIPEEVIDMADEE
jgi:hypothetical protein